MIRIRDIAIIICLLAIALLLRIYNDKGEGSVVQIDYDGYRYAEVDFTSLSEGEEQVFYINGTVVVVDNNGAFFTDSVCRGRVCIHIGRINKVGQTSVCVPQRVSIRIEGGDAEFDAVTG